MTDEEAFVRRIVASPGDDLPRLVYADWLDDRGDPRAAYLRAERETVRTGDVAKLREMATGLDPVWVARVSLPPIGVCAEFIEPDNCGPPVTESEIDEVERGLGVRFPPAYRAFLLNYNGWTFYPDQSGWFLYPATGVNRFTLREGDRFLDEGPDFPPPLGESLEQWLSRYVRVGHDPDVIGSVFLGVDGDDFGHVRILDTSIELGFSIRASACRPPRATCFGSFLESVLPVG